MMTGPRSSEDRVAVVTGAASGIGAATAAALRSRRWRVAGIDLRRADGVDLARTADVSDASATRQAVVEIERELGLVDALVSAAGHYEMAPISDIGPEVWSRMLHVHLGGALNSIRAVLPGMLSRHRGSIVVITSELAIGGGDTDAHYAAAKGALIGLVRSVALEAAPRGVRVNAVAPGPTDTPMLGPDSPWRAPDYLATLPLRRLVWPDEVAACVVYMLEDGTFCFGEVLSPNAGAVI